jgi:hypothetical protein
MSERKGFFGLRYPDLKPIYFDRFGVEFQISGGVWRGRDGKTLILMLPGEEVPLDNHQIVILTKDEWLDVLKYSDMPEYFEADDTGVVKAIHRKLTRVIAETVAWNVYRRAGFKCEYCGAEGPLTMDHYVPVELGGTDEESNLKAACRRCNKNKGNLSPEAWEARRGPRA